MNIKLILLLSVGLNLSAAHAQSSSTNFFNWSCPPEEKNFTDCDRNLIYQYSDTYYSNLNEYLRGRERHLYAKPQKSTYKEALISSLILSLKKLPPAVMTVYRGVSYKIPSKYKVGDCYSDAAFLSTSELQERAMTFLFGLDEDKSLLEIESYSGRKISEFTKLEPEKEVLFLPQTQFKITSLVKTPDYRHYKMKEVHAAECNR